MLGIGGAILIVPCLIMISKFAPRQAAVTSLIALLAPVGLGALIRYYKAGDISATEIKAGLWISTGIFVGAFVGAQIALGLPQAMLQKCFAIFLVVVAVRMWILASS